MMIPNFLLKCKELAMSTHLFLSLSSLFHTKPGSVYKTGPVRARHVGRIETSRLHTPTKA